MPSEASSEECALIIREPGKAQQVLLKYVVLILNYRYGMDVVIESSMKEGVITLRNRADRVRAVFVIQNDHISSRMGLQAFTMQAKVPLIILCPTSLIGLQMRSARKVPKVRICAWEKAFSKGHPSLAVMIEEAFKEVDVGGLTDGEPSPVRDAEARRDSPEASAHLAGAARNRPANHAIDQ